MAYTFQMLGAQVKGEPEVARKIIEGALAAARGDTEAAAKALGVGRRSLYTWMKALGIDPPERDWGKNRPRHVAPLGNSKKPRKKT